MIDDLRKDEIQGQIVHIYDGIEEADNELPTWWLVTFFAAIVFGSLYWTYYESLLIGDYPAAAYAKERLAALESGGDVSDGDILALAEDPLMTASGKALFVANCTTCHGTQAQGKEGPNLTDGHWLHGGAPTDIFGTIARGSKNGMPDWGPKLGSGAVKQLAAYIVSIRNTNVAGKAPQGELWEGPSPTEAPPTEAPPTSSPSPE